MSNITLNLNDLIKVRLDKISADAWWEHRIQRVNSGDGRVLQLGNAAVWELWACRADHGNGPCHEPLVTLDQAATLVGQPVDFSLVSPTMTPIEIEVLAESYGFQLTELYHFSDVSQEFTKAQG